MSEVIMSFTAIHQQDKNLYVLKMKLRDALYDVIKSVFPCTWKTSIFSRSLKFTVILFLILFF